MAVLATLPAGSIDLVCIDLPYGIRFRSRAGQAGPRWPAIANDQHPFIWWLGQAPRLLRDPGALLCFCRWDAQRIFRDAIETTGLRIQNQLIWDRDWRGLASPQSAKFAQQHNVIWYATKGRFTLHGRRPAFVFRERKLAPQKLVHPTEKPVALCRRLLEPLCPAGGVVLDPCAGSGSTGVAALQLGFRFIGIELDQGYCHTARQRLRAAIR